MLQRCSMSMMFAGFCLTLLPTARAELSIEISERKSGAVGRQPDARDEEAVDETECDRAVWTWPMSRVRKRPHEYFELVVRSMEGEIAELKPHMASLELSVAELTQQIEQKSCTYRKLRQLSEELRCRYNEAEREDSWPVEFCGKRYSKERLESQLSRLHAQAEVLHEVLAQLTLVRERAETWVDDLVQRPTRLEVQILLARSLQRMHGASQLSSRGDQLVANAVELLNESRQPYVNVKQRLRAATAVSPVPELETSRLQGVRSYVDGNRKPKRKVSFSQDNPIFVQQK